MTTSVESLTLGQVEEVPARRRIAALVARRRRQMFGARRVQVQYTEFEHAVGRVTGQERLDLLAMSRRG